MIKDPWNPTADEIREWAFSGESWPEQDWDIAVNNGKSDLLLCELACDPKCPKRDFFLHSIYFMVGDAIHRDAPKARIDKLKELIASVKGEIPADIQRWKNEAIELLSNPSTFEYRYWCSHMFLNLKSEQDAADQLAPLPAGRILRAIIGFIVGSGLTIVVLVAIFEGVGSATCRQYSPRGVGWLFLIVGAGVGCARLLMPCDLKFVQELPLKARVMIGAPVLWMMLVLSFVWVFDPFGEDSLLVAKIIAFPIVGGFLIFHGYAALFKRIGTPES